MIEAHSLAYLFFCLLAAARSITLLTKRLIRLLCGMFAAAGKWTSYIVFKLKIINN